MNDESSRCPTCGEVIPEPDRLALHLDGLDASRLECARQDIEAIKARQARERIDRGFRDVEW